MANASPVFDVVVVLPGIMGSTLAKNGNLVWAASAGSVLSAIRTFGRSIQDLALPSGIGDDHPDDGVTPVEIMPDLHVLPGLWTPVKGYSPLIERLTRIGCRPVSDEQGAPPGNLLLVPYDWRLSNRYNGARLKRLVEPVLERWRSQGGPYADAKVTFVCHSMGGLVARSYISQGGAETTRKLVTLGTPYRGAADALDQLSNGIRKGIGPFSIDLTAFAQSLPSCYQLLPSYACVEDGADLKTLSEISDIPNLDTARVIDAASFHRDLETAEDGDGVFQDRTHILTGSSQPTLTTATVTGGGVTLNTSYSGDELGGDGTVPAVAGPRGLSLDSPLFHHIADLHGNLQRNPAILDEVEAILRARPIVPKGLPEGEPAVEIPDLVLHGESIVVQGNIPGRQAVAVIVTDEAGTTHSVGRPRLAEDNTFRHSVDVPGPGAYTVTVSPVLRMGGLATITGTTLVWPATGVDAR